MGNAQKPIVYVFHGDDELAISESIAQLKSRLGDLSTAELNFTTLDGRSFSIESFETAGKSMPFLAERRLTVVNHPLACMQDETNRQRILSLLEELPEENAVVLAEYHPLLSLKERRQGKSHWLEEWGSSMGAKVYMREFSLARGTQLTTWIMNRARQAGGDFDIKAAMLLASLVGEDLRLADQEITKLLTFVNFERPVMESDVMNLTVVIPEGDIFEFVDALGNRDRKKATQVFHDLLANQDQLHIFSMVVRQFRLLLLAREILDHHGGEAEITRRLNIHPYVGRKISSQAHRFSRAQLENIYHRLLEIDYELKTGKMDIDLSLDLLIADIT
ncbi:MAG: DNA polymerase III subunit delta [Chloroflexota bacterium]|nr:MAG: DNA polymerase III subunit delta [Chloroflexota bacterium]